MGFYEKSGQDNVVAKLGGFDELRTELVPNPPRIPFGGPYCQKTSGFPIASRYR
jgi:hypothetical protein